MKALIESIARAAAAACITIFVSCNVAAAGAGSDAYCRAYASEMTEGQTKNLDYQCGYSGVGWHTWWDGHYGWCRDWANRQTIEDTLLVLRTRLEECIEDREPRGENRRRD